MNQPFESGERVCLGGDPNIAGTVVECSNNGMTLVAMHAIKSNVRLPHHRWTSLDDNPKRILVVDDNPSILRSVCRALGRMGFSTVKANNVDEALNVLDSQNIHVILTDYNMPGKDGVDLAREVKKSRPKMRLFLHSGDAEHADKSLFEAVIGKGDLKQFKRALRAQ